MRVYAFEVDATRHYLGDRVTIPPITVKSKLLLIKS